MCLYCMEVFSEHALAPEIDCPGAGIRIRITAIKERKITLFMEKDRNQQ